MMLFYQIAFLILKAVAVVSGHAGCGKTSLLLDYFKGKKTYYLFPRPVVETCRLFLYKTRIIRLMPILGTNLKQYKINNLYRTSVPKKEHLSTAVLPPPMIATVFPCSVTVRTVPTVPWGLRFVAGQ